MAQIFELQERPQSLGEEIANSVSHGLGLLATLAAFPVLVTAAHQRGDPAGIAGASVFATAMVLLYFTSTLFHALPRCRAKRVFQILDHSAIYFLIAAIRARVGLGGRRYGAKGSRRCSAYDGIDVGVSRDGLADPHCGQNGMGSRAELGPFLAICRRCRLHGGSGVLYGGANQVLSLCVASIRCGGHCVSLYRRSVVRGLIRRRFGLMSIETLQQGRRTVVACTAPA